MMLERSNLLLNMPTYCKEIHRYERTPSAFLPSLPNRLLQSCLAPPAGCSAASFSGCASSTPPWWWTSRQSCWSSQEPQPMSTAKKTFTLMWWGLVFCSGDTGPVKIPQICHHIHHHWSRGGQRSNKSSNYSSPVMPTLRWLKLCHSNK